MPYFRKKTGGKKVVKKRKGMYKRKSNALVTKNVLYKAINSHQETKVVTTELAYTLFNSGISSNTEYYGVLPSILAGTTASQRIGDEVRPIRLEIRGYISMSSSIESAAAFMSRMFCFQDKQVRSYTLGSSTSVNLLQFGAVTTAYTGALLDQTRPKNTDRFRFFCDRKHTFLKPYGYITGSLSGSAITDSAPSLVKYFTITLTQKHMPARLKFTDQSTTFPVNFAPFIALGYAGANNETPDTLTTKIGMSFTSTLYYKDA